jgi:hypothetical protein
LLATKSGPALRAFLISIHRNAALSSNRIGLKLRLTALAQLPSREA